MTDNIIQIKIDQIEYEAKQAVRQYFADELGRSNASYKILHEAIKEHSAFIAAAIIKKIEAMDSCDLQQAIGKVIIDVLKEGAKS